MTDPTAAAIYARISSDSEGTGLGVQRQLDDCHRLAADLGWAVAEEYVDNDYSASTSKPRPAYLRMLADLRDGRRDGVLVYHQDRLTRKPKELEEFVEVVSEAGVNEVRFVAGISGLDASGDGLLAVRLMGAVHASETATKRRRVRRKMLANAEAGLPHGGKHRPYGFAEDKIAHRPEEAAIIREAARRVLAGESTRSVVAWLNHDGVATVNGGEWQTTTLTTVLRSPRVAGLRVHRGEVVGDAVWEPIITVAEREQVLRALDSRKMAGRRAPRRYLLSGLLRCGKCGSVLYSQARATTRRYTCKSGPDHGGCGGLAITAPAVEQYLADAVLFRLDTPELADALAGRASKDARTAGVAQALAEDQERLDELASMFAAREVTAREWKTARAPIEKRIRDAERELRAATQSSALTGIVGHGGALRESWPELNLDRQSAIVAAVLDHAVISAGTPGSRTLDRNRVHPVWLL